MIYPVMIPGSFEYKAFHNRTLPRARGEAKQFKCIYKRCNNQAKEWSWIHGTNPYHVKNYRPMCVSCHRKYDRKPETNERISKSLIGNKFSVGNPGNRSPRTKKQMDALRAPRTDSQLKAARKPKTDEAKRKMSEAKKGKPWSQARRAAQLKNSSGNG